MQNQQTPPLSARGIGRKLTAAIAGLAMLATGGVMVASATTADAIVGKTPVPAATGTTVNDGVHVSLYDYWDSARPNGPAADAKKGNVNAATGGDKQEMYSYFQFGGGSYLPGYPWNNSTNKTVSQGLVRNNLNDAEYPSFSDKVTSSGQSLEYLFPATSADSDYAVAYNNVTGLFGEVKNNHYTFDSQKNFAEYDTNSGSISLESAFQPQYADYNKDEKAVPKFLPFNTKDGLDKDYDEVTCSPTDSENCHKGKYYNANYAFGMKVTASFMQPKGGKVVTDGKSEDMVFNFTGDDDVWVYVDDALVLDIGGIHPRLNGSINFATGEVLVEGRDPTTLKALLEAAGVSTKDMVEIEDGHWVFPDYSGHTLKFFYLERGHGASNCKLDFNLQTVPDGTISVGKQIVDSNTAEFSDAEFTMSVALSGKENGNDYTNYVGDIYVCAADTSANDCKADEKNKTHTDNDGKFKIKNGQYALLVGNKDYPITQTTWYKVTEYAAGNYAAEDYQFKLENVTDSSGKPMGNVELGRPSAAARVDKHPYANVQNKFMKKDKYAFAVKKVMADEQTVLGNTEFTMKLTDANGKTYTGDYYYWTASGQGQKASTDTDGSIRLKAGEEIRILGLNPGTKFTVTEADPGENYGTPSYKDNEESDSDDEQTVTVGPKLPLGQVTVTNSLKVQVEYSPFRIMKQLDGAPLRESQFRFQVHAVDEPSAKKAGFKVSDQNQHLLKCDDDSDTCEFMNQDGSNESNTRALARNANELTFTATDVDKTYVYEYKELDTDKDGNKLPSAYVLDENTYRVEVKVEWADSTVQKDLKVTTTIKKKTDSGWDTIGEQFVWTSDEDKPTDDALPTVTFENEFKPISNLPLTGGATGRQWLVTGLGLGGMALLLVGASGVWRNRQRLI